MKRLASKKSHSWWWDSHISPKNSKWLSENLERKHLDVILREAREKLEEYEKASNVQGVHLASIDEHHDPKDKIATDAEAESGGKTVVVETVVCNHEDELKSLKEAMEAASKRFDASKLKALEVESDLHLESVERTVVLEAEISNHKNEIKCLKEAMESAAKQFEAEISLKDQTIAEYKIQHDEAMNKFMQENSTHVAELKNSIAHLKLESEQLSEKKSSLQIIILKQEQMIKELEIISKASSERLLHEKSILESKVFSLMGSESIHASTIQALETRIRELDAEKTEACNASVKRIDELNQSLDASKLKIDMLTSEKDELNARVSKLIDDAKCRDNNCIVWLTTCISCIFSM